MAGSNTAVHHGLKSGPKAAVDLSPLDLSDAPPRGWRRLLWFADKFLVVPSGKGARDPFKFAAYQKDVFRGLLPMSGKRPSQGVVSMPRGNAKSTSAAVLACYFLFADDRESLNVLCVAKDLRQAGIVWNKVRRMIELSPDLLSRTKVFADRLVVPGSNSQCIPMPSDEDALQGWEGVFLLDELHVVTEAIWNACAGADGKVPDSLVFAFSTPSVSEESVMWSLCEAARREPRKDFFFREYTSDPTHPVECEHCAMVANPAIKAGFLEKASMGKVRKTMRESEFRRVRLGQWLDRVEESYVSGSQLDAITEKRTVAPGTRVILAVDGSTTGDSTAITLATVEPVPFLDLARIWEPSKAVDDYTVPMLDVEDELRLLCVKYDVAEVLFDPWLFQRSMEVLTAERLPVVKHPQTRERMGPLTSGLYEAVANRTVAISDDPTLRTHFLNARVHDTAQGPVIRKAAKWSPNKIDAAHAALMAWGRAVHHANRPQRTFRTARTRR